MKFQMSNMKCKQHRNTNCNIKSDCTYNLSKLACIDMFYATLDYSFIEKKYICSIIYNSKNGDSFIEK